MIAGSFECTVADPLIFASFDMQCFSTDVVNALHLSNNNGILFQFCHISITSKMLKEPIIDNSLNAMLIQNQGRESFVHFIDFGCKILNVSVA